MDANAYVDFATLAIKAGQTPDPATGALNTPIYETTTFAYPDMASYEQKSQAALRWTPGYYFYSRSANPTTAALEQKVAAHNSLVERTYKLEGQMTEVQHDIRDLKSEVRT